MPKPWLLHKVNLPVLKIQCVEFYILRHRNIKRCLAIQFFVTAVKSLKNTCQRINFQLYWLVCYFQLYERKNIYRGNAVKYCNYFSEVPLKLSLFISRETLVDYLFQGFPYRQMHISYKSISNAETSSSAITFFKLKGIFVVA